MAPAEHEFESRGLRITFDDRGTGPTVVLLHALGRSADDWRPVIDVLARDFRCVAIDFPGHGGSDRLAEYSFEALGTVVLDLIEHLSLDSFAVVAHSMGAMTAFLLAPDFGASLTAFVAEDTAAPTDRHEYPEVAASPPGPVTYDWEARRQLFRQLNNHDPQHRRRVAEVTAPVLLIAGGAGDGEMVETRDLLPDATISTIDVGHWVHQDALTEFLAVVRPFLLGAAAA